MSCAACSSRVERAVSAVDGVTQCSVSLLTGSMQIDGNCRTEDIVSAVEKAGYRAYPQSEMSVAAPSPSHRSESDGLLKRFLLSLVFLLVLMYFSMGHMMWNFPVPHFLEHSHSALALIQLLLSSVILIINHRFFISGFRSLVRLSPNMDALVSIGSGVAYIYSVYVMFRICIAESAGSHEAAMKYTDGLYFESAAMILTLITLGKFLESLSKSRTANALESLMKLAPATAVVIRNGKEVTVQATEVSVGEIFVLRAGDRVPFDGEIISGECSTDESALTGESLPKYLTEGDKIYTATVSLSGYAQCRVLKTGEDTTLSQLVKMVSDAAGSKAPIARIADRVSGIFVPTVMTIAAVTLIVWLACGYGAGFALSRAISVLVISCPCALGLATPVAIMVGSGVGAKHGILYKNATALETAGKIKTVVMDKTGTITNGTPVVTDIFPLNGTDEKTLVKYAYSAELKSEHPLSRAIAEYGKNCGAEELEVSDFKTFSGRGISARTEGGTVYAGNISFISGICDVGEQLKCACDKFAECGKTPLIFSLDTTPLGIIAVADTIREETPEAVAELRHMGINTVMLTGDNAVTAKYIAGLAGIERTVSDVLPSGKATEIAKIRESGFTAMVGDGINDAPALTSADIGIAIGAGADIAIESADVVLMNSSPSDIVNTVSLGRSTLRNIYENLFWAFFYNILGIPLAAGVWIPVFGWELNPMFAVAAMSLSSVCVVTNALRLNLFKPYRSKKSKQQNARTDAKMTAAEKTVGELAQTTEKEFVTEAYGSENTESFTAPQTGNACDEDVKHENKPTNDNKEVNKMKKTLKIEGMMCAHCEAHVKKALTETAGVSDVTVSHEKGEANICCTGEVTDEKLREAVSAAGYNVTDIINEK